MKSLPKYFAPILLIFVIGLVTVASDTWVPVKGSDLLVLRENPLNRYRLL